VTRGEGHTTDGALEEEAGTWTLPVGLREELCCLGS
jgi:hypothetical protein